MKKQPASRRFWICAAILLFDLFLAAVTLALKKHIARRLGHAAGHAQPVSPRPHPVDRD
jgi:hypothetical protein